MTYILVVLVAFVAGDVGGISALFAMCKLADYIERKKS